MVELLSVLHLITCLGHTAPLANAPEVLKEVAGAVSFSQASPTLHELKNLVYQGFEGTAGPVSLVDGRWEGEPFVESGASRPVIQFVGDFMLSGDLDGNGSDETVVLLTESSGGSGTYLYLAVVGKVDGELKNRATKLVGDRVQVRSARITQGQILLDLLRAGPSDPACCPGELAEVGWSLSTEGNLVERAGSTTPHRFSLGSIGGVDWVLRGWNLDEPAPREPEVTLRYQDGRLTGKSGCNQYFASVEEGATAGQVSLGPVGATMMACPKPIMDVESRYLRLLESVKRVGFMATRLALFLDEESSGRALLFEARSSDDPEKP